MTNSGDVCVIALEAEVAELRRQLDYGLDRIDRRLESDEEWRNRREDWVNGDLDRVRKDLAGLREKSRDDRMSDRRSTDSEIARLGKRIDGIRNTLWLMPLWLLWAIYIGLVVLVIVRAAHS